MSVICQVCQREFNTTHALRLHTWRSHGDGVTFKPFTGKIPWNKGLTANTDNRVKELTKKQQKTLLAKGAINRENNTTKLTEYARYRADCQFRFALNDYPDKFDFELIRKYGWYKATNRGNNPTGVSRDHMISIKYGWLNNIPAEMIAHPANCMLVQQHINSLKKTICSITVDELRDRIANWGDTTQATISIDQDAIKEKQKEKRRKKAKIKCSRCQNECYKQSVHHLCKSCYDAYILVDRRKCERPSKPELIDLLRDNSIVKIAIHFGVSDNAVRKWLVGYDLPSRRSDISVFLSSIGP